MGETARNLLAQLGLTVRDLAQYVLPGFYASAGLALWLIIYRYAVSLSDLGQTCAEGGIWLFMFVLVVSYLVGNGIACLTHVIDSVTLVLFKKRLLGVPVKTVRAPGDFRSTVHDRAYELASEHLVERTERRDDTAFDSVMEFMLYETMHSREGFFLDIQRYQAILFMRKHLGLATPLWLPLLIEAFGLLTGTAIVLALTWTFLTGYRRLYRRTFFERLPICYLLVEKARGAGGQGDSARDTHTGSPPS